MALVSFFGYGVAASSLFSLLPSFGVLLVFIIFIKIFLQAYSSCSSPVSLFKSPSRLRNIPVISGSNCVPLPSSIIPRTFETGLTLLFFHCFRLSGCCWSLQDCLIYQGFLAWYLRWHWYWQHTMLLLRKFTHATYSVKRRPYLM